MADVKRVYTFGNKLAEGNGKMRELLGGKGANLAEMTKIGLPVPQGFTVTTEACTQYYEDGRKINDAIQAEIMEYIEMSTPHAYWLARSFVLLADLYAAQGKTMEAKQYLLSLQNNYSGDDDIAGMISERLERFTTEQ